MGKIHEVDPIRPFFVYVEPSPSIEHGPDMILVVVAYGVFYYDWGSEGAKEAPFQGVSHIQLILCSPQLTIIGPHLVQEHCR